MSMAGHAVAATLWNTFSIRVWDAQSVTSRFSRNYKQNVATVKLA